MGEIAESMINGELCEWCGVYLEPNETVYKPMHDGEDVDSYTELKMPTDGSGLGFPVVCGGCAKWTEDDYKSKEKTVNCFYTNFTL